MPRQGSGDVATIMVEQKYAILENDKVQLLAEHGAAQTRVHQLELELMKQNADLESRALEISACHKSMKALLNVIDMKNLEVDEMKESSKQLLQKVLALTKEKSGLEGRVDELVTELTRSIPHEARVVQNQQSSILERSVELSQGVAEYQQKPRESSRDLKTDEATRLPIKRKVEAAMASHREAAQKRTAIAPEQQVPQARSSETAGEPMTPMLLVRLRSDEGHLDAFYLPDDAVAADAKKRFCDDFKLDPDTTHLWINGRRALLDEPLARGAVAGAREIFVKTESGQLKTRTWPVTVSGKGVSYRFKLAGRPPTKQELYKLAAEAGPRYDFFYINDEGVHPLRQDDTTALDKLTLAEPVIEIIADKKD